MRTGGSEHTDRRQSGDFHAGVGSLRAGLHLCFTLPFSPILALITLVADETLEDARKQWGSSASMFS